MSLRVRLVLLCAAALMAPSAAAADSTVVADPNVRQVDALDGTVVWVSPATGGREVLMLRDAAGTRRVPGAPAVRFYRTIDLGHGRSGRLVLTYQRCDTGHCVAYRDDLRGHHTLFRGLAPRSCALTTAPSLWSDRAAFGVLCHRGRVADDGRSGLYLKRGTGAPRHLPRAKAVARYGITSVSAVDVTGGRVAAVFADIYSFATSQTTSGTAIRTIFAGASEGESDARVAGLALTPTGALWALTDLTVSDEPNRALVFRRAGGCQALETVTGQATDPGYPAIDLAVDGHTLYLVVPGTGIVEHAFTPDRPCS